MDNIDDKDGSAQRTEVAGRNAEEGYPAVDHPASLVAETSRDDDGHARDILETQVEQELQPLLGGAGGGDDGFADSGMDEDEDEDDDGDGDEDEDEDQEESHPAQPNASWPATARGSSTYTTARFSVERETSPSSTPIAARRLGLATTTQGGGDVSGSSRTVGAFPSSYYTLTDAERERHIREFLGIDLTRLGVYLADDLAPALAPAPAPVNSTPFMDLDFDPDGQIPVDLVEDEDEDEDEDEEVLSSTNPAGITVQMLEAGDFESYVESEPLGMVEDNGTPESSSPTAQQRSNQQQKKKQDLMQMIRDRRQQRRRGEDGAPLRLFRLEPLSPASSPSPPQLPPAAPPPSQARRTCSLRRRAIYPSPPYTRLRPAPEEKDDPAMHTTTRDTEAFARAHAAWDRQRGAFGAGLTPESFLRLWYAADRALATVGYAMPPLLGELRRMLVEEEQSPDRERGPDESGGADEEEGEGGEEGHDGDGDGEVKNSGVEGVGEDDDTEMRDTGLGSAYAAVAADTTASSSLSDPRDPGDIGDDGVEGDVRMRDGSSGSDNGDHDVRMRDASPSPFDEIYDADLAAAIQLSLTTDQPDRSPAPSPSPNRQRTSPQPQPPPPPSPSDYDADIAAAIKLSLATDQPSAGSPTQQHTSPSQPAQAEQPPPQQQQRQQSTESHLPDTYNDDDATPGHPHMSLPQFAAALNLQLEADEKRRVARREKRDAIRVALAAEGLEFNMAGIRRYGVDPAELQSSPEVSETSSSSSVDGDAGDAGDAGDDGDDDDPSRASESLFVPSGSGSGSESEAEDDPESEDEERYEYKRIGDGGAEAETDQEEVAGVKKRRVSGDKQKKNGKKKKQKKNKDSSNTTTITAHTGRHANGQYAMESEQGKKTARRATAVLQLVGTSPSASSEPAVREARVAQPQPQTQTPPNRPAPASGTRTPTRGRRRRRQQQQQQQPDPTAEPIAPGIAAAVEAMVETTRYWETVAMFDLKSRRLPGRLADLPGGVVLMEV